MGHPVDFTASLRPEPNKFAHLLIVHEDHIVHVPVLLDAQVYSWRLALGALAFWVRSMLATICALLVLAIAGSWRVKCAVLALRVGRMLALLLFIQNNLVELLVLGVGFACRCCLGLGSFLFLLFWRRIFCFL